MNPGDEVVLPPTADPVPLPSTAAATGPDRPLPAPVVIRRPLLLDLRPPLMTALLVCTNLIWYVVGVVTAVRHGVPLRSYLWHGNPVVMWWLGAVSAPDLLRGDWPRLLSCCFVHGTVWHLTLNLLSLAMAGSLAELFWGRWRVLLVYLLAGLGGSCLAMALRPTAAGGAAILVGASGAVWGLLTAIVAWLLIFHRSLDRDLVRELGWRLGLGFLMSIGLSLVPGVSWEAHAGGGMAGFGAAGLFALLRFGNRLQRIGAAVLLLALPVLCVGGLIWAMKSGPGWAPVRIRLSQPPPRTSGPSAPAASDPRLLIMLTLLRPEAVRPVENQAILYLTRTPERRPTTKPSARDKVADLRATGIEAANRLSRPTGNPAVDVHRARVKAFADARVKSLTLLLAMLDANTIPDAATWKAWGDSRREADRLWKQ